MSQQNETQTSKVVVHELVERPDGSTGIGNSIEVSKAEAVQMIRARIATSIIRPIGEVPAEWEDVEDE